MAGESRRWKRSRVTASCSSFRANSEFCTAIAAWLAMFWNICRSFSVNAFVAICESRIMMPSKSPECSSGTAMLERMPCMIIECAPLNRLSTIASELSTASLVVLT